MTTFWNWVAVMGIRLEWMWLESLAYRFICPYPIDGKIAIRDCVRAGRCGCDNFYK